MKKPYNRAPLAVRLRQLGLTALLAGAAGTAQAQLAYTAPNVTNTLGTYTDLGSSGAVIATANTDDANSADQPIGFSFNYNGTSFTRFVLNTNGFIKLGAVAPTGRAYTDGGRSIANGPIDGSVTNLLMVFNQDLEAGIGGTEYRVSTTGMAPNRVCTIQWKNVRDKSRAADPATPTVIATQYANISFQIQLFETSNTIQFVYGTATAAPIGNDNPKFVGVGIKGTNSTAGNTILGSKSSATPWAQTPFIAGPYVGNAHNVRVTELPQPGRTYSFVIPVANDAATQIIYGFGQLAVPGSSPVDIKALVRNAGTNPLTAPITVTLNVTGANTLTATQVVPSLGVSGATALVTFAGVSLPNLGNNTITVSVPGDNNNNNNSRSEPLVTNATTTSLITAGVPPISAFGFGAGAQGNYFGAKFRLTQPRDITAVNAFFFNEPDAVGNTAYGVVVDAATGAVLARSPDFVVTATSLNRLHTFNLTASITVPAGDVIVGMATVATAAMPVQFFLMGVQGENPNRPDTYFTGQTQAPMPVAPNPALNTVTTNIYRYMLEMVTAPPATCPTPSNIAVANVTTTSASVSFTGPSNGTAYEVVVVPAGTAPTATSPATPGTASPIALTGLTQNTPYDIYVRALCGPTDRSQLAGPVFFSTPCVPAIVTAFPYTQNFDVITRGQALPCGITVQDVNNDNNTWYPEDNISFTQGGVNVTENVSRSAPNSMTYVSRNATDPSDDWFFLPAMNFASNRTYRLSFWYRALSPTYTEDLEVKMGSQATAAAQTDPGSTLLFTNAAITNGTFAQAARPAVADISNTGGLRNIGFHCKSLADQFFLCVDDVQVSIVLASSAAMNRAVNVYPNPSNTGVFNLDINGANATAPMQVEVTNMLGQRVFTGTAKDNFQTQLNLSDLAAGIYSLKVRNGNEYMQQQLSIVK